MKKLILLLLLPFLIQSCQEVKKQEITNKTKSKTLQIDTMDIELPVLIINKKEYTTIKDLHFKHSVGGKPIKEETLVMMKYDDDYLEIKFECRNNPRLDQNYYTEDNSTMYNQEVFELFISNGDKSVENYLEIEINPNNALFLGKIMNNYKSDKKHNLEFLDTKTAGVTHSVEKDSENDIWKGYLRLPIKLLQYPESVSKNTFRLNIYRIISNENHDDPNWSNNATNSTYACWSSTMAKTPQFHAPDYFGFLILE